MNIAEQPFSEWLEQAVRDIYTNPPDHMMIMLYRESEGTVSSYHYNVKNRDMAIFQQEMRMAEIRQLIRDNPEEFRDVFNES